MIKIQGLIRDFFAFGLTNIYTIKKLLITSTGLENVPLCRFMMVD